jgi:thiamine pyrophosphate-dependent acetolactate synthase large subunit-like protein
MVSAVIGSLERRAVVARLLRDRDGLLVVTGLGSPSYDVHAAGDHDGNFYLWGAMGAAALVGLGLAQAKPDRTVMVVTGDGEQLMGLGGLATIAIAAPANLVIVVLDNGHYGETGMQRSHTGLGIDLASIARAAGFAGAVTVTDQAGLESAAQSIREGASGPRLYVVKVKPENLPRSLPPRDGVHLKNRLRTHLGFVVA